MPAARREHALVPWLGLGAGVRRLHRRPLADPEARGAPPHTAFPRPTPPQLIAHSRAKPYRFIDKVPFAHLYSEVLAVDPLDLHALPGGWGLGTLRPDLNPSHPCALLLPSPPPKPPPQLSPPPQNVFAPQSVVVRLDSNATVDVSTCHTNTTIGTSVTVMDMDLQVLATSGKASARSCGISRGVQLQAGQVYIIEVDVVISLARGGTRVGARPGRAMEARRIWGGHGASCKQGPRSSATTPRAHTHPLPQVKFTRGERKFVLTLSHSHTTAE